MPNQQDARQLTPGAFSALLTNYNGQERRDVRPLLLECNLYEDLFAPGITADLVLADAQALVSGFPIVGGETLELDWASAGRDTPHMRSTLRVYKLDNRTAVKDRTSLYSLHAASGPVVLDHTQQVDAATPLQPADAAVRDLYRTYLQPMGAGPLRDVEGCQPLPATCYPRYSPLRACAYLASEAASLRYPASPLCWFETHTGWHFQSLATLLSQPAVETYYYFPTNIQEQPTDERAAVAGHTAHRNQLIISMQQHRSFDLLRALANGQFGGQLQYLDLVLKTYGTSTYQYSTQFAQQATGAGGAQFPALPAGSAFLDTQRSHSRYHMTRLDRNTSQYARSREGLSGPTTSARPHTLYGAQRSALLMQLQNTSTMLCAVPGWSRLEPGQLVRLVLPEMSGTGKANQQESRSTSGLYLITSLVHRYSSGEYTTTIECMRGSYPQPIRHQPSPDVSGNPNPVGA